MKYGGYSSELEQRLLESRDTKTVEVFDDFEMSLDLPERVKRIEVESVRDDTWRVVMIGSYGSRRQGNLYTTESAALTAGRHLVGLVMK